MVEPLKPCEKVLVECLSWEPYVSMSTGNQAVVLAFKFLNGPNEGRIARQFFSPKYMFFVRTKPWEMVGKKFTVSVKVEMYEGRAYGTVKNVQEQSWWSPLV